MNDRIDIEGITTRAIIGVNDYERVQKQQVILDLAIFTDVSKAARSDDLDDTVNYRDVTKRVLQLVEATSYGLIEALIEDVARTVLTEFGLERVQVRIQKPHALRHCDTVAVTITRDRSFL